MNHHSDSTSQPDSTDEPDTSSDFNSAPMLSLPPTQMHTNQQNQSAIPDSVRGAPEELKPAIRKKQNKESARRSRRRRKELVVSLGNDIDVLLQRARQLETRVQSIEQFLSKSGLSFHPRPLDPMPFQASNPPVTAPMPSPVTSVGMPTEGSPRAEADAGRTPVQRVRVSDEDVDRLIESCMDQL